MHQDPLTILCSPARLAALHQLGLLDTPARPAFDRLASLAARVLHAPIALVSLVDEERLFFTSAVGLDEPWATRRSTPLSYSFCQYVVESGEPLIIADAREHPLLRDNLAISDMGFVAYAGMPLIAPNGQRLGSFCVIDTVPRTWAEAEIDILRDLTALANTEIKLLVDSIERQRAAEIAHRQAEQHKRLLEVAQTVVSSLALDEILPQLQRTFQMVVAHDALSIYWLDAAAGLLRPAHQVAPIWRSDQAGSWPIPLDSGLAGAAARSGRAEMVNNAQLDPRSVYPPGTTDPPEHHQISIPLQVNKQVRGVFLIHRTSGEPFTEQEFELAQIFMSFASLAIENARLFEQTKLTEQHQRLLIEQVPCQLWTTDRDLRFTSSVGITPRELHLQPGSVIGMSIYELFETDDPQLPPIAAHRRALAGESSAYDLTWHGRVFQTHVQPFRDTRGQVTGCIGVALDITEARQVEEALREEFTFRTAIIERAAEGLCVYHEVAAYPYHAFTVWNDRMIEITGYTMDEINRLGWYQTVYVEPDLRARALARIGQIRHGDDLIAEEWEITRADGQKRIVAFSTSILATGDGIRHILALLHDITERKQAELALAEREMMLRSIGDNLPNGMIFQVVQTAADKLHFTYVSEGAARAANATPAQIYADPALILNQVIEEDQERYWAAEAESFRNLSIFDIEVRMRPPGGVLEWRHIRSRPRQLSDGRLAWDGFSIDITERKQAEAELRESEDRYRTFFEHSIDAILLTAPDGRIFAANPAACRIFCRSEEEICQGGRAGVIDATDPRLPAALEQRARTGMFKGELTFLRKDGTPFPGELSTALFRDRDGLVKTSMIIRDITDRKRAEEALRESQTLLQGIVDHAPMSIVIQDIADGRYLLVNRSLEVITGLTVEQLIGKTIAELYPPEAVAIWRAQDRSIAITRQSIQVEDDIRHSDGTVHSSLGIKFPLYDAKGDVYAIGGIFTDITDRKRAEQEREQLIDALQDALTNIKTLRGLLPICAACKKIRDDSGYWSQIEAYVQAHSDAVFSHGICPDCARRLYGDIFEE